MTIYYAKQIENRNGQVIGFSEVIKDDKKTRAPKGTIRVNMNSIDFDTYCASPKQFYLSGNTLKKIERL